MTKHCQAGTAQLALLIKDAGISKELFEMVGFETSSSAAVMHSLSHALSMLMPDADPTESLGRKSDSET